MVGNFVSDVERFLRWIHPGILLLSLIHLGRTNGVIGFLNLTDQADASLILAALAVAAIISGNIIYMLYRYGFHQFLQWALFVIGKSDVAVYAGRHVVGRQETDSWPDRCGSWIIGRFFYWSNEFVRAAALKAGGDPRFKEHMRNRDYLWGLTHGLGMTVILLIIAQCWIIEDCSVLGRTSSNWQWILIVALALIWLLMEVRNYLAGRKLARMLEVLF
jgi:hypothetical protein